MGFFSKLKHNLSHGGVKVDFDAPNSASFTDKAVDLKVKVTAKDACKINSIEAKLVSYPMGDTQNAPVQQDLGTVTTKQAFDLAAGETKEVTVSLPLSVKGVVDDQSNEAVKQIANVIDKADKVMKFMDQRQFAYDLIVTAAVEGVSFHPSKQHSIQMRRPGEIGGRIKIGN